MHNLLKPLAHVSCSQCHQRCAGMFCNFSPQTFADFTAIGRSLSLPSGSVLMRESDRCEQIYSICSGHVKLSCLSKIGQTLNLKIAFPGEVLGLGAAISAAKVELTAETMVPTVVKVIRRDEFLAFVNSHGEASLFAAQALAEEYKTAFSRARSLALSGVSGRVAGLLPELARSEAAGKTEPRFNMTLTHDDIAEFVSTTRETVSRTLARFREDKFIQINGSSVQILERSKLEALVA